MIDVSEINMISKYLATVTPFPFSISTDFKFPLVILHHMHIISSDAENKTFISESIVPDSNKICVPSFKNSLSLFNFSSLFSCVQNANCAKSLDEINGNLGKEYIANSELISCVNGNSTSTGARLVVPAGVYAISASAVWENGTNNLNGNRRISVLRGDFYNAEAVTANDAAGCRSAQVQSCCGLFISSGSNVLRIFLLQNNTSSAEIAAKNIKLLALKIK